MKTFNPPDFAKHFIALSALFILGDAIITLPKKNADRFTFLGFLISFLISLGLCFIVFAIKNIKLLIIPSALLSVYIIGDTFISFFKFISDNLLRYTVRFFIILPFVLIIIFLSHQKQTAVLKFSLICFVFCLVAICFFFFATAKDFTPKNIFIYSLPSFKGLFTQTMPYLTKITLPTVVLSVYARLLGIKRKPVLYGLAIGNILLSICLLNSVLLFGSKFSGRLDFPYASAISTVTFGSLFTRMDGFAYFIYFASCIIKIGVCIYVVKAVQSNLCKQSYT